MSSKRSRKDPGLGPVNGLTPAVTETDGVLELRCPLCGELGDFRFPLLARRAFEAHVDEEHGAGPTPLEQIRTLVDLAEAEPGTWACQVADQAYVVRQRGAEHYEVEVTGRRATIHGHLTTLDAVRIAIGGHAGLVNTALATAAVMEAERGSPSPDNVTPLG